MFGRSKFICAGLRKKNNVPGICVIYVCTAKPPAPTIYVTGFNVLEMRCHFRDVNSKNGHLEIENMAPTVHLT